MDMAINPLAELRWFEALADCEAFVKTVLQKKDTPEVQLFRQTHPVHFTWVDRSWNWGWGGPTIINNYAPAPAPAAQRPSSEQEKKDNAARVALLVGGILSLVGAGLVGYFYTRLGGEYETVQWVHEIQGRTGDFPKEHCQNLAQLFELRAQIHKQNYENIRNQFLSSAIVLGGAFALVAGGMTVAPMAITAGWVAVFAGSVFATLNLGLHWGDEKQMRSICRVMQDYLPQALGELQVLLPHQGRGEPPPYYAGLASFVPAPPPPPIR
jgi:hypothetical protein